MKLAEFKTMKRTQLLMFGAGCNNTEAARRWQAYHTEDLALTIRHQIELRPIPGSKGCKEIFFAGKRCGVITRSGHGAYHIKSEDGVEDRRAIRTHGDCTAFYEAAALTVAKRLLNHH